MPIVLAKRHSGVVFSLLASILFAVAYYSATLLAGLGGEKIFGWRVIVTAPLLGVFITLAGRRKDIRQVWQRTRQQPLLWLPLVLSSGLLSIQLWLFMWAPVNGYALDVSLGYFLLPLTLVITGRLVFQERINRWKLLACLVAAIGVANELFFAPRVSWPTFLIALGYPCYFVLRRKLGTNHLGGMWFDLMLSLPIALFFVLSPLDSEVPGPSLLAMVGLILLLGTTSAVALIFMILASDRLSLGIFGLLGYVEPALLILVALFIGERLAPEQWPTYIAIWMAVLILIAEGLRHLRQPPENQGQAG